MNKNFDVVIFCVLLNIKNTRIIQKTYTISSHPKNEKDPYMLQIVDFKRNFVDCQSALGLLL